MRNCRTLWTWLKVLAVVAFFVTTSNAATVLLQWAASSDLHVVGYNVYCTPKAGGDTNVVQVGITAAATLSSLTEGDTYQIFVTAFDGDGVESDPSNTVEFTPSAAPVLPQVVNVTLAWDPSSATGVVGYRVYSSPIGGGQTNVVSAGNSTSATVSNLVQGVTYQFYVTAVDGQGVESAPSNLITYTVPISPQDAPPALGLLRDQVVIAGDQLQFQVTAVAMTVPAQALTFSLGAGAPSGAVIDPVTGVFSWTPTAAQAPGARTITVVVTDEGGLSAQGAFNVIVTTPGSYSALKVGGFANGSVQHTPYGTMSASGEMYVTGSEVLLEAAPITGFTCTGWTINSQFYPNNPISVTMSTNVLATPTFKKSVGSTPPDQPTQISMAIGMSAGKPAISIGGELGAWVLEGSSNLKSWIQVGTGLTSDLVMPDAGTGFAFYRIRSAPLLAFDASGAVLVNVNP